MQTRASVRLWKSESRSGVIDNMREQCCGRGSTRILRVIHTLTLKFLPLAILLVAQAAAPLSFAQRRVSRNGAHSSAEREAFTAADRRLVERAIGQTCVERTRDPSSSMAI